MSTKKKVINTILAATTAALMGGCTKEPSAAMQNTPNMQSHIDASQHMKRLMHDMDNVLYERHRSELERDEERTRYAYRLSDKLITISQEIKTYPQESQEERFKDPKNKEHFMRLADQLKAHGETIRSLASEYRIKPLNEEIQRMTKTCNSCHSEFNPTGPRIQ